MKVFVFLVIVVLLPAEVSSETPSFAACAHCAAPPPRTQSARLLPPSSEQTSASQPSQREEGVPCILNTQFGHIIGGCLPHQSETVVSIQGYPQPSLLGLRKEKCEKSTTSDFTKNTVSKNNEDSTKTTVKDVSNDGTTVTDSQETIKETSEVHQHSKDNESTHNTATKVQKKKARKGLFGSSDEEVTETDTVETDKTVTKDRDVTSQTTINKESKTFTNGDGSSKKTENSVDKVTSTNEKTKEDENLDKTKTQKIVKKKNQTLGLNGLVQVKKQHTDTITKTQREHEHNVKTSNSTNTTHYKTTNGTSETHDEDGYTKDSYGSSEQTSDGSSSSDESGSSDSSESVSKTSQDSVQISVLNLPPVTLEKNSDGKDKGALLKGLLKKKLHKGLLK